MIQPRIKKNIARDRKAPARQRPPVRIIRGNKDQYDYSSSYFTGGLVNPITGAGTDIDKNSLSFFQPSRLYSRNRHETIYNESWAAAKFIDIPVDDMFVKWRRFVEMEDQNIEKMEQAETKFKIKTKLKAAMKSARLYGTGLFVILTKEAPPDEPLNINRMLQGDLSNIIVVDRFDATIVQKEPNPFSRNYGMPIFYRITLKHGGAFVAHHSRVLRFDGRKPLSDNSWQVYDQDWGVAPIIPVLTEIFQDANVAKGAAHLVNEASIKNQKISGFEDALSGQVGEGEMTLDERMALTTRYLGLYRTNFMDTEDDFTRDNLTFAGLPDLLDRNALRLAAAAEIPEKRFWGKSVVGLNSTGEGEAREYALKVESDQENKLPEPLDKIDKVLAADAGIQEPVQYEFVSLLDLSEKDKAEVAGKLSQAIVPLINVGAIDEDEAREALKKIDIFSFLEAMDGVLPEADPQKRALAAAQIIEQLRAEKSAEAGVIDKIKARFKKWRN